MIINKIYETQSSVAVACFLPGWAKDLSAPLYFKAADECIRVEHKWEYIEGNKMFRDIGSK